MAVVTSELITKAKAARAASRQVRSLSTAVKNRVLYAIADALEREQAGLFKANALDMAAGREAGLSEALLDRLMLDQDRLTGLAHDVRNVAALPDPVGESFDARTLPNGIQLARRRVPLGVIGAIYESRPHVTVDISTLAFKSGNTVVLRGGKEAVHSNDALASLVRRCLEMTGVTPDAVQFIQSTDRSVVEEMVKLDQYIDLLIPRGGASLVSFVAKEATMPAITGGIGVCHTYVDSSADVAMAEEIVSNAKVQRPSVCNALDTVLVHPAVAPQLLPKMAAHLAAAGVELRCDRRALALIGPAPAEGTVKNATEEDWGKEFLALVLAVKVVDTFQEAIDHIEQYGSGHTEVIVTADYSNAMRFVDEVDAAVVLVNASTRFNDGGQFGLGAEVAISTNKLHARGPMGLRELTTYKWVGLGQGQVRQ